MHYSFPSSHGGRGEWLVTPWTYGERAALYLDELRWMSSRYLPFCLDSNTLDDGVVKCAYMTWAARNRQKQRNKHNPHIKTKRKGTLLG
jgi:hypothetical protein